MERKLTMRHHKNRNANVVVEEIKRRAPLAAEVMERQGAAFAAEQTAEAKLVALALELINPALPSLVSKYTVETGPSKGTEVVACEVISPDLWLLASGQLAEWPERNMVLTITPEEATQAWDPFEILSGLSALLAKQIDGRGASAQRAEKTAAKINAIVTLLMEA
jgi:hypothetical protein